MDSQEYGIQMMDTQPPKPTVIALIFSSLEINNWNRSTMAYMVSKFHVHDQCAKTLLPSIVLFGQ